VLINDSCFSLWKVILMFSSIQILNSVKNRSTIIHLLWRQYQIRLAVFQAKKWGKYQSIVLARIVVWSSNFSAYPFSTYYSILIQYCISISFFIMWFSVHFSRCKAIILVIGITSSSILYDNFISYC
jgi:hypothetical protein